MVHKVMAVVPLLEGLGIHPEVIDPRTLVPLDKETIFDSVKKTGHVVIVHEAVAPCGFGAELITMVCEELLDFLDAPPRRVCGKCVPVPYNKDLESRAVPSENDIFLTVKELLEE
jgi:pyruvate dehydrogenase E1 component beta subunit